MMNRLLYRPPHLFRWLYSRHIVWRANRREKVVYLTFDDGPIPEVTPWLLDYLKQESIKATFFCVGDNVTKHPAVYQRILNEGHGVGNHTYNHLRAFSVSTAHYLENVELAQKVIETQFFRPPHGHLTWPLSSALRKKFTIVLWDILTHDYDQRLSPESCVQAVKKWVRNGSVIVFHDSLKAEKNMRTALPQVVDFLKKEGYRFEIFK